jgi:nucleoside-diphosphate-sugar epimerase
MKILITGAGGFIGSRVVEQLRSKGHDVYAIFRETSRSLREPDFLSRFSGVYVGDLKVTGEWCHHIYRVNPDVCIHLAWFTDVDRYVWSRENLDCLQGSINLLEHLSVTRCKRFISAGTCFEYRHELSSSQFIRLTEDAPLEADSLYAASKISLYQLAKSFCVNRGMEFVHPRIFYTYGPGSQWEKFIPVMIRKLMRNQRIELVRPGQVRDYLYVDDLARAFVAIAESPEFSSLEWRQGTCAINLGGFFPITTSQLVLELKNLIGSTSELDWTNHVLSAPEYIVADNSELVRTVQWTPQVPMVEGLSRTVEWVKQSDRG